MLLGVTVNQSNENIFEFDLFSGFNVPTNYDDVGLNCGGLSIQRLNGN